MRFGKGGHVTKSNTQLEEECSGDITARAFRSVLRLPWIFREAWVIQNLNCGGGAEVRPIPQNPDHLLVRRYFDKLWTIHVSTAGTNDGIAIGEPG